ncbi:hypothetical protein [Nesterenkonia ebinurensis]|uniref:hypothetical protein n=1 Tax=Nesterenkonia ebinurensis TaxID=2608252 RepID=UPI00123CA9F7|nr:hypothetical protein [Nesterenkonia ebinurensis]
MAQDHVVQLEAEDEAILQRALDYGLFADEHQALRVGINAVAEKTLQYEEYLRTVVSSRVEEYRRNPSVALNAEEAQAELARRRVELHRQVA